MDGHRYISPDEIESQEQDGPAVEAVELVGVLQAEENPSGWLPEAQAGGDERDFAPLDDAPADADDLSDQGADSSGEGGSITCDVCDRSVKSERGRDTHRRQAHPEA
ncbi:hypothetical protein EF919_03365 [Streptomyces sp. WAC02707]|uniref:hypothetical protein n=1 Tax=Streptomyces sp. WAC02707 TaxID=2487417 RepID=UPI000F78153E|nr:hypothetical protein [Streptomyces sp. WAC02707]RSS97499.1 hypothetical protein EF919_03365 [Streptomyces sp. WAC02707]